MNQQRIVVTILPLEKQRECYEQLQKLLNDPIVFKNYTDMAQQQGPDKAYNFFLADQRYNNEISVVVYNALLYAKYLSKTINR